MHDVVKNRAIVPKYNVSQMLIESAFRSRRGKYKLISDFIIIQIFTFVSSRRLHIRRYTSICSGLFLELCARLENQWRPSSNFSDESQNERWISYDDACSRVRYRIRDTHRESRKKKSHVYFSNCACQHIRGVKKINMKYACIISLWLLCHTLLTQSGWSATARNRYTALRSDHLRVAWRNRASEFRFFFLSNSPFIYVASARFLCAGKVAGHEPDFAHENSILWERLCAYEERKTSAFNWKEIVRSDVFWLLVRSLSPPLCLLCASIRNDFMPHSILFRCFRHKSNRRKRQKQAAPATSYTLRRSCILYPST